MSAVSGLSVKAKFLSPLAILSDSARSVLDNGNRLFSNGPTSENPPSFGTSVKKEAVQISQDDYDR